VTTRDASSSPADAGSSPAQAGLYQGPPAPPPRKLLIATCVALAAAAIVLVAAVLPAEYGIDPLGIGRATGLMDLFAAGGEEEAATPANITPGLTGPVFPRPYDWKVDTREFTIAPGTGIEFKYELDRGSTFVYSWKATNFVNYDFHTEPEGKPSSASESFDKGEAAQRRGAYTAPYDGIHGWYWENGTNRDVKVTLQTAGFYEEGRLFLPKQPPQTIELPERPDAIK
jgi:hypothetical protein